MSDLATKRILAQIESVLEAPYPNDTSANQYAAVVEWYQATLTLSSQLYGIDSKQTQTLTKAAEASQKETGHATHNFPKNMRPVVQGTLRAMRADVMAGLIGDLGRHVAGELLGDLLGLAKEAMTQGTPGSINVAAVLAAAAYEDTLRRMGDILATTKGRPELRDVIDALKKAGALAGAPLTTALGYLKFRNDALHADWARIDVAVVGSCIAFVEGLLLKHFS